MAIIVQRRWPFRFSPSLDPVEWPGFFGVRGDRHPRLPGWWWVTFKPGSESYNGYYDQRDLRVIGTGLVE